MLYQEPVIAAISTPVGMGAVGIVRMSGKGAIVMADQIFVPYDKRKTLEGLPGYSGLLGKLLSDQGDIDEAIVYVYPAPRSYTGEDVVEINCHGGVYLVQRVLQLCLERGARLAQPGEFTKRAFLNGKMKLTQAEAIGQLISAQSEGSRKAAMSAKDGVLSTAINDTVQTLKAISGHLAAWNDYPDEDIAEIQPRKLEDQLAFTSQTIKKLLETYRQGVFIRDGIPTAIVGKPNVGKSTLMNLLSGTRRSIVSDIPGTTRDMVRDQIQIGDYMLQLADTAGLRRTGDEIERQGVELTREQMESAQLILAVFDASDKVDEDDKALLEALREKHVIGVLNKVDLPERTTMSDLQNYIQTIVPISAKQGSGRQELVDAILHAMELDQIDSSGAVLVSQRQQLCLKEAVVSLEEAIVGIQGGVTLDAVAVSVEQALQSLLSLTGERATDSVVDEVFSRFCVGK